MLNKCVPLLFLVCCALPLKARVWTNNSGKKIDATIIKASEESVTLKRSKDRKQFTLKLTLLSQPDRKFVADWLTKQEEEKTSKPKSETETTAPAGFIDNFDAEWPKLISLERGFEITEVSQADQRFVYHSPHFEFVSDVKLSKSVVKRFSDIFEATLQYVKALPFSSQKALNVKPGTRRNIFLFSTLQGYIKAGGSDSSSGFYTTRTDSIYVQLSSVGVKKVGNRFTLDRSKSNDTLPHEITHMFMDRIYFVPGARGWFSEGIAEYVSITPYRGGKFKVRGNRRYIQEAVTGTGKDGKGGNMLGTDIKMQSLKGFMLQPYSDFTKKSAINYGMGALVTYYFIHMEDGGSRKNLTAFLKAIRTGKSGQTAIDVLLNGRTYKQMEADISKAWRSRGVKIQWGS